MARYVILCAFGAPPPADVVKALRLRDPPLASGGEQRSDLWLSAAGIRDIEAALAAALAAGQVRSAALLPTIPPPDQRWIISEWHGRLVVHDVLTDQLERRLWADPCQYELINVRTFEPARAPAGRSVPSPSTRGGPRRAEWVETATEYRASVETGRATLITAPVRQITTRMRDWFGDLADERIGGAIAILAMSGVTPSASSMVVLRSPAALGLHRVTDIAALAELRKAGRIRTRAWGASSGNPARSGKPHAGRRQGSRSPAAWPATSDRTPRARYSTIIEINAAKECEVHIDTGLVFEQETLNGVQNLAIAAGLVTWVDVGQPATITLPAWCLNEHLAGPDGEATRPTPLCLSLPLGTDQRAVWCTLERSLHGAGTPA